jgi:hypothetical protein
MPRAEQVADERLRGMLVEAYAHVRAGRTGDGVRGIAAAFLHMLQIRPDILAETVAMRTGAVPVVMRWPQFGANLKPDSVRAGKPEIEFVRDRFSLSEAITYFEFTVETAIRFKV